MLESNQDGPDLLLVLTPHGGILVEPKKGIGGRDMFAAQMANGEIGAIEQTFVATKANDGLERDGLAVRAGIKVKIVNALQLGEA